MLLCICTHHERKNKSFQCSYVKVIKIFDKVLSKVAMEILTFSEKISFYFSFFTSVRRRSWPGHVYNKTNVAPPPPISWHANRYRYFDTLRWRDFPKKSMPRSTSMKKFSNFFGGVPVYKIPGRTFPVDVMWAKSTVDDYVEASVKQAWFWMFLMPKSPEFYFEIFEINRHFIS